MVAQHFIGISKSKGKLRARASAQTVKFSSKNHINILFEMFYLYMHNLCTNFLRARRNATCQFSFERHRNNIIY